MPVAIYSFQAAAKHWDQCSATPGKITNSRIKALGGSGTRTGLRRDRLNGANSFTGACSIVHRVLKYLVHLSREYTKLPEVVGTCHRYLVPLYVSFLGTASQGSS